MSDISTEIAKALLGTLVGAMIFFPSVVAPLVFKTINEVDAGRFLRALFPRYYIFMILVSGFAALGLIAGKQLIPALLSATIAISTLAVRQILVPRINRARDAANAGDSKAQKRFDAGHRFSVLINMAQLCLAIGLLISLA